MEREPFGFYEFFAGGGMARLGLGDQWRCLMANDICEKKAEARNPASRPWALPGSIRIICAICGSLIFVFNFVSH